MKVILEPKTEEEVLKAIKSTATLEEIYENSVAFTSKCVVHLCGCEKCSGDDGDVNVNKFAVLYIRSVADFHCWE